VRSYTCTCLARCQKVEKRPLRADTRRLRELLVVQAVKEQWKTVLAPAIKTAIDRGQATNPVYLVVRPKLMSEGGLQISKFRRYPYPGAANDTNLRDEFDTQVGGAQTWFCAIDLTRFATQLDVLLS
jgi:hypothetical protein